MILSPPTIQELYWWIHNISYVKGKAIGLLDSSFIITRITSKQGGGAVTNSSVVSGRWLSEESQLHINVLELKAVYFVYLSIVSDVRHQHIQFQVDKTVVAYLNHMSFGHGP